MKNLRVVFFSLFAFTALISINMICNLLRNGGVGYGMWPVVMVSFVYVIAELIGLIVVIINRNQKIIGIFSIIIGIATLLSGFMAFGALGTPAPQILGIITLISMIASFVLFGCFCFLGVLFFLAKDHR
ncbi:MAG: hypothetical protein FWH14_04745 [Oscillospiraceae bacterium]|nr:hypothetical protein [Oscillospiraceae bacterium]